MIEIKILSFNSADDLEREINISLQSGWEMKDRIVVESNKYQCRYVQVMKREPNKYEWAPLET